MSFLPMPHSDHLLHSHLSHTRSWLRKSHSVFHTHKHTVTLSKYEESTSPPSNNMPQVFSKIPLSTSAYDSSSTHSIQAQHIQSSSQPKKERKCQAKRAKHLSLKLRQKTAPIHHHHSRRHTATSLTLTTSSQKKSLQNSQTLSESRIIQQNSSALGQNIKKPRPNSEKPKMTKNTTTLHSSLMPLPTSPLNRSTQTSRTTSTVSSKPSSDSTHASQKQSLKQQ